MKRLLLTTALLVVTLSVHAVERDWQHHEDVANCNTYRNLFLYELAHMTTHAWPDALETDPKIRKKWADFQPSYENCLDDALAAARERQPNKEPKKLKPGERKKWKKTS